MEWDVMAINIMAKKKSTKDLSCVKGSDHKKLFSKTKNSKKVTV